eukprot:7479551-Pyramimonas_sp.AAC.1
MTPRRRQSCRESHARAAKRERAPLQQGPAARAAPSPTTQRRPRRRGHPRRARERSTAGT